MMRRHRAIGFCDSRLVLRRRRSRINIEVCNEFFARILELHAGAQEVLADANLRARLRMSTLYSVGTNYKYLVVGTDNAAEWYTGYFTKYGDGGVDLVPLVHFTKGEVRDLARELGVPNEIIEKKPSAGLWEGQTDENEMGTSYEMIDKHIKGEDIPEKDRKIQPA